MNGFAGGSRRWRHSRISSQGVRQDPPPPQIHAPCAHLVFGMQPPEPRVPLASFYTTSRWLYGLELRKQALETPPTPALQQADLITSSNS